MSGIRRIFFDAGELNESDIDTITKNCSCNIQQENYSLILTFVQAERYYNLK